MQRRIEYWDQDRVWYVSEVARLRVVSASMPLKDVAEAGGWKDTATLLKCYQHADPDTLDAVVNAGQRLRMTV